MVSGSSPVISPSMTMLLPMIVFAMLLSLSLAIWIFQSGARAADAGGELDLHLHRTGEASSLLDHQAGRANVADDPRRGVQHCRPAGGDVTADLTLEGSVDHFQVGLDGARLLDGQSILQRDASFDASLHDQILIPGDLAPDGDLAADEARLFVRHKPLLYADAKLSPPVVCCQRRAGEISKS